MSTERAELWASLEVRDAREERKEKGGTRDQRMEPRELWWREGEKTHQVDLITKREMRRTDARGKRSEIPRRRVA